MQVTALFVNDDTGATIQILDIELPVKGELLVFPGLGIVAPDAAGPVCLGDSTPAHPATQVTYGVPVRLA